MTINRKLILDFATKKHEGQVRRNSGLPYITHPIAVADMAESYGSSNGDDRLYLEMLWTVGLCHDLLEDTDCTIEELEDILSLAGFDSGIANLVILSIKLLTKREGYEIVQYLIDIRRDYCARIAKLCDLDHNMSDLQSGNLLEKYKLCRYILQ